MRRAALVSLIALVGAASTAAAQDAAAPAPAPAAPAMEAPAAAAPAAPAPAVEAAPAAPAAPLPERPTTGEGAMVLDVLEKVCIPAVKGGNLDQLAKANGMKKQRDRWVGSLGAKPYTISIASQGSNTNVCEMTLEYAVDGERPIIQALNIWSFLHVPQMEQQRADIRQGADFKRTTTSWEFYNTTDSTGLVFVQLRKPDGSPVARGADRATLLYSERKIG